MYIYTYIYPHIISYLVLWIYNINILRRFWSCSFSSHPQPLSIITSRVHPGSSPGVFRLDTAGGHFPLALSLDSLGDHPHCLFPLFYSTEPLKREFPGWATPLHFSNSEPLGLVRVIYLLMWVGHFPSLGGEIFCSCRTSHAPRYRKNFSFLYLPNFTSAVGAFRFEVPLGPPLSSYIIKWLPFDPYGKEHSALCFHLQCSPCHAWNCRLCHILLS